MIVAKTLGYRLLAGIVLAAGAGFLWHALFRTDAPPRESPGGAYPRPIGPFHLTDQDGQPFGLAQLRGKWTFVFFGYTRCPDVCPTALTVLKNVRKRLDADPARYADTRVLFVSVDPNRDRSAVLKAYIGYFGPRFRAATGAKGQIDALARQFGAVYLFRGDTEGGDYQVHHSASIYLVDPLGRIAARFDPPQQAQAVGDAFLRLHDYYNH